MKRSKLFITSIIVMSLFSTLFTGCSSKSADGSSSKTGGIVTIKYVCPGADQPDQEKVLAAVNKKMQADGVKVELQIQHIGWDAWDNKTNVMLSTGEDFDILNVMENGATPTGAYVSRGAATPLDDLIKKYAPDLMSKFPANVWNAAKVNGKIYTVPAMWRDATQMGGEAGYITVRQDLLDKLKLPIPKTVDELISTGTAIQKSLGKNAFAWDHELARTPVWLHRTYPTWPFYADFTDGIVYVDEQGNVKPWVETDEFKQDCTVYRKMYTAGLLHPDVLSLPNDSKTALLTAGNFVFGLGTVDLTAYPGLKKVIPDIKLSTFQLAPEKVNYTFMPLMNSNIISSTSKHPEAAMQFINWLYKDQANHDLLLYGIEGTDYKKLAGDKVDPVLGADKKTPIYTFDFWQIGYYKWQKFQSTELPDSIRRQTTTDPKVQESIVAGFTFNPEPVKTEYANVVAQMASSVYPIKFGLVAYDKGYPAALKKLQDAGLDKVVTEYNKQFQAFLKTKKK